MIPAHNSSRGTLSRASIPLSVYLSSLDSATDSLEDQSKIVNPIFSDYGGSGVRHQDVLFSRSAPLLFEMEQKRSKRKPGDFRRGANALTSSLLNLPIVSIDFFISVVGTGPFSRSAGGFTDTITRFAGLPVSRRL